MVGWHTAQRSLGARTIAVRGPPSACVPFFDASVEKRAIVWFSRCENQNAPKTPHQETLVE
jgi:hypothetical protein